MAVRLDLVDSASHLLKRRICEVFYQASCFTFLFLRCFFRFCSILVIFPSFFSVLLRYFNFPIVLFVFAALCVFSGGSGSRSGRHRSPSVVTENLRDMLASVMVVRFGFATIPLSYLRSICFCCVMRFFLWQWIWTLLTAFPIY